MSYFTSSNLNFFLGGSPPPGSLGALLHHGCVHLSSMCSVVMHSGSNPRLLSSAWSPPAHHSQFYTVGVSQVSHPQKSKANIQVGIPTFRIIVFVVSLILLCDHTLGHHQPPPRRALTASCSRVQGDVGMWGTETTKKGELFLQGGRGT